MERDIRRELLDAMADLRPTIEQLQVVEDREVRKYCERCANWWQRWFNAIGTINGCVKVGGKAYEQETLGYIVWLLHKRPMKGKADDIFRPEGEL